MSNNNNWEELSRVINENYDATKSEALLGCLEKIASGMLTAGESKNLARYTLEHLATIKSEGEDVK